MATLKYYDTTSSSWKYLLQNNGNYSIPVLDELLSGTINGTNKVFTTTRDFQSIELIKNGVTMHLGDDFTITGTNQITFVTAPATGSKITANYWTTASYNVAGTNSTVTKEVPVGTIDGANGTFTTSHGYLPGTLQVFVNGVAQSALITETNPATGVFNIDAPMSGATVSVAYQFAGSVSGNADTVDGIHANATPTANNLLPLNSYGLVAPSAVGLKTINSDFTVQGARFSTTSATYSDIPGISMTYTAGPTNERIMMVTSCMAQKVSGAEGNVQLTCNGVTFGPELYYNPGTSDWNRGVINCFIPVAANQTITLKLQAKAISGGTFYVINETSKWMPKFTGLVWPE